MGKKKKVEVTKKIDVAEAGRRGGEARAARMSEKERSESCRRAALARWADHKAVPAEA